MSIRFMNEKLTRNKVVIMAGLNALLTDNKMSSPSHFTGFWDNSLYFSKREIFIWFIAVGDIPLHCGLFKSILGSTTQKLCYLSLDNQTLDAAWPWGVGGGGCAKKIIPSCEPPCRRKGKKMTACLLEGFPLPE